MPPPPGRFVFETRFYSTTQAGLEPTAIPLHQPPKCWDHTQLINSHWRYTFQIKIICTWVDGIRDWMRIPVKLRSQELLNLELKGETRKRQGNMKYAAYSIQYGVLTVWIPRHFLKDIIPKHVIHLSPFSPNNTYHRKCKKAMTEVSHYSSKACRRLGKRTAHTHLNWKTIICFQKWHLLLDCELKKWKMAMYSVCKVLFLSNGDLFMEKRKGNVKETTTWSKMKRKTKQ